MKNCVAILDIGSSKITGLIGMRGVNSTFSINGKSELNYEGFSGGRFFYPDDFVSEIKKVYGKLMSLSPTSIKEVFVGVPGCFIKIETQKYKIEYRHKKKIKEKDIEDLMNAGKDSINVVNYDVIDYSPIYYNTEESKKCFNPLEQKSSFLGACISYYLCNKYFVNLIENALYEHNVKINYTYTQYAENRFLFKENKPDETIMLLDIGYITSDFSISYGGGIVSKCSVDYGGGMITGELLMKYSLDTVKAERLKRMIDLGYPKKKNCQYRLDDGPNGVMKFNTDDVNEKVIECLDALVGHIDNFIDENQKMLKEVKVIHVTGGGVNFIRGALNHIGERLSMNFESIMPDIPQFNKPIYSSSIGLLDNALSKRSN